MKVHLPYDTIENTNTGEKKDIVVETGSPVSAKDVIVGGTLIVAGIWYLLGKAFKNGCKEYNKAEMETLDDLGLLH